MVKRTKDLTIMACRRCDDIVVVVVVVVAESMIDANTIITRE